MSLSPLDFLIIASYLLFALTVGVAFSRRASSSTTDYFLAGRNLPWWLVGTSIVATTFASDTPLAITEITRGYGMWRNWYWWNITIYHVLVVFLFARLWRRAEVVTENELLEMRYDGKSAALLRGCKAFYFAVIYNLMVMGWVIYAISSIISTVVGLDRWTATSICLVVALVYTVLSGFYGIVLTDLVQFGIAIFGSIYLAVISVNNLGGISNLKSEVSLEKGADYFNFFPTLSGDLSWQSDALGMLLFLGVMWWAQPSSDGGGYVIQRISACKDERHSVLAVLYSSLVTVVRGWPWIAVAYVSIVLFPDLGDSTLGDTAAYPLVMKAFLTPGFKGILVTSFLAAFMSTIDTHLNWGASYITIDLYKRFLVTGADEAHYVRVSKVAVVLLMIGAGSVAAFVDSISGAWEFAFLMGCGIGPVLILRWFWWRINATSELTALLSSTLLAFLNLVLTITIPDLELFGMSIAEVPWHIKALIILPISMISWISATVLTRPVAVRQLNRFYQKVVPGGAWGPVDEQLKKNPKKVLDWYFLANWIAGILLIMGLNFAVGTLIFASSRSFVYCLIAFVIGAGWFILRVLVCNRGRNEWVQSS
jgi:SSS family transporter